MTSFKTVFVQLILCHKENRFNFVHFRTSHSIAFGTQWPMPLHPKQKTSDNYDNGKRSAINQSESKQILPLNRIEHAMPRLQTNNLSTDFAKFIAPMPDSRHEAVEK